MVLGGVSLDMAFDDGSDNNFGDTRDYNNLPAVQPIQRSTSIAQLPERKSSQQQQQMQQNKQPVQQHTMQEMPQRPPTYDNSVYIEDSGINNTASAMINKNMNKRMLTNVNSNSNSNSLGNKNSRKKYVDVDDDDDDISFMDKVNMKRSDIHKFLTLCAILLIALCYHDFLKLSINKIADGYNLNDMNKYYLIFATPTVLLLFVLYLFVM